MNDALQNLLLLLGTLAACVVCGELLARALLPPHPYIDPRAACTRVRRAAAWGARR